ncbi:MAG: lamin tail domain-containing protein [Acidimicrobiales bacterium]
MAERRLRRRAATGIVAVITLGLAVFVGCTPDSAADETTITSRQGPAATPTTADGATPTVDAPTAPPVGGPTMPTVGDSTMPTVGDSTTATVVAVIDGDTFDVNIGGDIERVRLIGIDTPERSDCLYDAATDALAELLAGRDVELVVDTTDRDRFGRLLRYAWVGDVFVNETQVASGFAVARRYPPDVAEAERLEEAEASAAAAVLGRWDPDACGPRSTDLAGEPTDLRIDHIEFDAPGDDSIELNGEWVRIVNVGPSPVALDGWQLRDDSTHRFLFPPIELGSGADVVVYSGCGDDTETELHWCSTTSAIWNNDGDTAYLIDPSGNIATSSTY